MSIFMHVDSHNHLYIVDKRLGLSWKLGCCYLAMLLKVTFDSLPHIKSSDALR